MGDLPAPVWEAWGRSSVNLPIPIPRLPHLALHPPLLHTGKLRPRELPEQVVTGPRESSAHSFIPLPIHSFCQCLGMPAALHRCWDAWGTSHCQVRRWTPDPGHRQPCAGQAAGRSRSATPGHRHGVKGLRDPGLGCRCGF